MMIDADSNRITLLLANWSGGDESALDQLMPLVYGELRRMARRYTRRHPAEKPFQTTELIHEAYLKIVRQDAQNWQNRAHFFGVAAQTMRHILVDYARAKNRQKRGGAAENLPLDETLIAAPAHSETVVALDDALKQLAILDARKASVVEMKFFGGLTTEEIAAVLKISPETVKRDWYFSRNWLLREITGAE